LKFSIDGLGNAFFAGNATIDGNIQLGIDMNKNQYQDATVNKDVYIHGDVRLGDGMSDTLDIKATTLVKGAVTIYDDVLLGLSPTHISPPLLPTTTTTTTTYITISLPLCHYHSREHVHSYLGWRSCGGGWALHCSDGGNHNRFVGHCRAPVLPGHSHIIRDGQ
jgi:hypothetical protein